MAIKQLYLAIESSVPNAKPALQVTLAKLIDDDSEKWSLISDSIKFVFDENVLIDKPEFYLLSFTPDICISILVQLNDRNEIELINQFLDHIISNLSSHPAGVREVTSALIEKLINLGKNDIAVNFLNRLLKLDIGIINQHIRKCLLSLGIIIDKMKGVIITRMAF